MAGGRKEVDPEARRVFNRLTAQAVTLGFGNAVERVRKKSEAEEPESSGEWTTMEGVPEPAAAEKQEKITEPEAEAATEETKRTRKKKAKAAQEEAKEKSETALDKKADL